VNSLVNLVYFKFPPAPPTQVYIDPDVYVHALLGRNINWRNDAEANPGEAYIDDAGAYWERVTNLYPTLITAVIDHGTYIAPPIVPMNFSTTTTKQQAIDRLNAYYSYLFYDKWFWDSANSKWQPEVYWVPFLDIDGGSGLDLPTKVNLTCGSTTTTDLFPYLAGEIEVEQKGEDTYNFVTVRGQTSTGGWIENVKMGVEVFHPVYNSTASSPYILPTEYYEENPDILVQADCDARAYDVYDYYSEQTHTYRIRFKARADLELYQLVAVSGFESSTYGYISNGDYRIIEISYRLDNGAQINEVEVVLMVEDQFASYLALRRPMANSVVEIQKIIKNTIAPSQQTMIGFPYSSNIGTPSGNQNFDFYVNLNKASSYWARKTAYIVDNVTWSTATPFLLTLGSNGVLNAQKLSS
jgi:hypothetical protein